MKPTLISMAVLSAVLSTSVAQAGGLDRSGQDTSIILKDGNLLEITAVTVSPEVTGVYKAGGDVNGTVQDYSFTNIAFRTDISDDFAVAIIQDEPYGANVKWTDKSAAHPAASYFGINAEIKTSATTVLISNDVAENVTVYGGLKSQSVQANVVNPYAGAYELDTKSGTSIGYVIGAAIEKPEIAMRVALTYHSKVSHKLSVTETGYDTSAQAYNVDSTLSLDTPEAVNLDFQTGIAENTLLFGSIRHVKWTQFKIEPNKYSSNDVAGIPLKEYTNNSTTYSIGLGRKLTDQWSAAVTYGTEAATGEEGGPLGPTDGFAKMGVGVTYTGENATVTLGMQKVNIGDSSLPAAEMTDNSGIVTAVKVGYTF